MVSKKMGKDVLFGKKALSNIYVSKIIAEVDSDEEVVFNSSLKQNEFVKHHFITPCYVDVSFNRKIDDHKLLPTKKYETEEDDGDEDDVVFQTGPTFQDSQEGDDVAEEPDNIVIQTIGCIGQGLTSTVYSAHMLNNAGNKLKGTVAVKVFNKSTTQSVVSGEVRLLRRLDHSNIITFLGYLATPISPTTTPAATPRASKSRKKTKQKRAPPPAPLPPSPSPPQISLLSVNNNNNDNPQSPSKSPKSQQTQSPITNNNNKPKPESSAFTPNPTTIATPVIHQLVMEHCSRGNLFDLLHQPRGETKVPLADIARKYRTKIIIGVATGMAYLHKYGIVHRDLSSKNILLTHNWEAKIADFGQAKQVPCSVNPKTGQKVYDGQLTGPGGFGTDPWRAPEVWRRPRGQSVQYSLPIDVYSYGIMLWEMYHLGHVPWATILDVEEAVKRGKRPKLAGSCPAEMGALIQQCWLQSPEYRLTFPEVLEDLCAFLTPSAPISSY